MRLPWVVLLAVWACAPSTGAPNTGAPNTGDPSTGDPGTVLPSSATPSSASSSGAPSAPPNIVLLIADDMDHRHFGFTGHPLALTPSLDALAARGTVFTHGFVPMSRCRPSMAALLSGRWPHQNGIYYNVGAQELDPADTLPNLLAARGYVTVGQGKFWEGDPRRMGFSNKSIRNADSFVRQGQERLFAFVDAHAGKEPLFVWWAPTLPHMPHEPPERLRERFPLATIPVPASLAGDPALRAEFLEREQKLLGMIAWLDEGVGELVARLEQRDAAANTLFVFLVDNGWTLAGLAKGWALDAGLRTPVVFCGPGVNAVGQRFADLVSVVDVYATILDYAGVPLPPDRPGRSLRPRLEGRAFEPRPALYGALYPHAQSQPSADAARDAYGLWARTARWKYILTLRDVGWTSDPDRSEGERNEIKAWLVPDFVRRRGTQELYDLDSDPDEQHDLAARPEHAELLRRLEAETLAWWSATGGGPL